ncbi:hypothetical protein RJT34_09927 [Clitoria ternatea]|uniref:RING-type E3 ubiquitin transferase n=1 Tax=Clitoria ternatea TaxID=43366 RepID=A0AAN9K7H0_CLITE
MTKQHSHHAFPLFFFLLSLFLLTIFPPPATAQLPNTLTPPPPDRFTRLRFDKSMAIVLVILVVVFFILGFLSVYTRHCAERRIRGRFDLAIPIIGSHRRQRGLDREIVETFPTFVYSTVKSLKIGRATLECAVCLNEFEDDETLRLIPKCSHVFHPECIDAWLVNHSTCPVCRANLVPKPGDPSFVVIQIPDPNEQTRPEFGEDNGDGGDVTEQVADSPKVNNSNNNNLINQNRSPWSRSTGFRIGSWFPRSHSTGHSLVQPGENHDRFTLRLPNEVRNQLVSSTLSRTKSCGVGVTFTRQSSARRGYRTRSVGNSSYDRPDRRGFSWTPPFTSGSGSNRSPKKSPRVKNDVGERSSDRLFTDGEDVDGCRLD